MSGLIMAAQMLLGLSILVILHELGHFLAARAFGIKVEKFYLFFDAWGIKLFKFKYKDCEYGIGWLPLGGYVKIAGMIDESMDTEQLKAEPQPYEFRSKPAWQKLIVMLAGIFVNIVLGIFIFWMLTFKYGETYVSNDKLIYGISPGKVGESIGLETGDRITAIDGVPVVRYDEIVSPKVLMGNAVLTVKRGNETKEIQVPSDIMNDVSEYGVSEFVQPRIHVGKIGQVVSGSEAERIGLHDGDEILSLNNKPVRFYVDLSTVLRDNVGKELPLVVQRQDGEVDTLQAKVPENAMLGFQYSGSPYEIVKYGFFESLPIGASKAWSALADNAKGLGKIATGQVKATKALSGPVGIARMFGAEVDWYKFWTLVGLLSMVLALMNLLPIPALDGGHAMFLLIEMIKGKPLSDKFMERAQLVGFIIVVFLMVFALGNDIMKVVGGKLP
ncbi:RIP metalloprotease RseP [Olivibacter sitiensis]|uniref:RIP metalloprotease RseP n=1 Tax=Olivibacter sitiensis TaxID=376470 RepID=UPI0003FF971D|nr:RIP metalloprotease RseP [Olivibacter sitiensis]